MHPSPSGAKLQRVLAHLDMLNADDERDGVFLDYCSLPQGAFLDMPESYFENNNVARPQVPRSHGQRQRFDFAMWEMTRFYAFSQCEVIVEPVIDKAEDFPGFGEPGGSWGSINTRAYHDRGWCHANCDRTGVVPWPPRRRQQCLL